MRNFLIIKILKYFLRSVFCKTTQTYLKKSMNIHDVSPNNIFNFKFCGRCILSAINFIIDAAAAGKPTASYNYDDGENSKFFEMFKKRVG